MRLIALALLLIAAAMTPREAKAHSWYDGDCCNDRDCFPVASTDVRKIEGGWLYLPTGNVFKNEPPYIRIRPSKDEHFHVCIGTATAGVKGHSYCIYIPDPET